MLRTLFRRNVALMVGVVLLGQVIAGLLVMVLLIAPQVDRVANVTADMVAGLSQVMDEIPPARRAALLVRIEEGGEIAIRQGANVPTGEARFPNFIERMFIHSLSEQLAAHRELAWRTGEGNRLWFRLRLGDHDSWISVTPPTRRGALASLLYALGAALVVALGCGVLLQRRLDAPLQRLAVAVDDQGPGRLPAPLDTSGPEEVAAVAGAFNRMTARLRRDEAERSLMLAGVSHDMRTPLTRLRLCLEMMQGGDVELDATAARQVDRIEAMLEQFLDFARGFADEPVLPCAIGPLLAGICADYPGVTWSAPADLTFGLRRNAVSRALGNLAGNALRHGAEPVAITARKVGTALELAVCDAGNGIAPDIAAQLMQPFARGDSARGGDGAGLGLAIVERVTAAHGGTFGFAHRDGRFCAVMTLPAA